MHTFSFFLFHWIAQMQEFLTPSSSPSSNTLDKIEGKKKIVNIYLGLKAKRLGLVLSISKRAHKHSPHHNCVGSLMKLLGYVLIIQWKQNHEWWWGSKLGTNLIYLGSNSWTWAISWPWESGQVTFLFAVLSWFSPSTNVVFLRLLLRGPSDPQLPVLSPWPCNSWLSTSPPAPDCFFFLLSWMVLPEFLDGA